MESLKVHARSKRRVHGNPAKAFDVEFVPPMVPCLLVRVNQNSAQRAARNSGRPQKRRVNDGKIISVAALSFYQVKDVGAGIPGLWRNLEIFHKVIKNELRLPVRIFDLENYFWKQVQDFLARGRNDVVGARVGLVQHSVLFFKRRGVILVHKAFHSARSDDIILPRARIIFGAGLVSRSDLENRISPVIQERGFRNAFGHHSFRLPGENYRARHMDSHRRRVASLYVVEVRADLDQVSVAAGPNFFADAAFYHKGLQG